MMEYVQGRGMVLCRAFVFNDQRFDEVDFNKINRTSWNRFAYHTPFTCRGAGLDLHVQRLRRFCRQTLILTHRLTL